MESQIDIIPIALNEREMVVLNERFDNNRILGNRIIIDCTVNYIDYIKFKNKQRVEQLHDINRVRLYKGLFLPFKLLGIDGNQPINAYSNEDEELYIEWKWF